MKLSITPDLNHDTLWARVVPGPEGMLFRVLRFGLIRESGQKPRDPFEPNFEDHVELYEVDHTPFQTFGDFVDYQNRTSPKLFDWPPVIERDLEIYEMCQIQNTIVDKNTAPLCARWLGTARHYGYNG